MLSVVCKNNRQTTMTKFKRKQIGRASLAVAILSILSAVYMLSPQSVGALLAISFLGAAGYVFSSQTVEVDTQAVRWNFASRFWTRHIALADIASVNEIQTALWQGWGIRWIRGGWCYSVSGRNAVELTLTNGRRVVLGTDRPRELAAALATA